MAPPDDPLLADLTPEQREAVTTRASPLCIVAGAGSGKTRVLTRRIAWQVGQGAADPRRVLALTFTRRAAAELRDRLRRLGLRDPPRAGTFHAAALAQLRRYSADRDRRPPEILESRAAFLAEMRPRDSREATARLAAEIDWARARMIPPERYLELAGEARRHPPRRTESIAAAYAAYEEAKRRRRPRLFDFDDLLAACRAIMESQPDEAAAQRWRNQHLLVDEFQDVNPLQFALLRSWMGEESTVAVVGDPDQAIYGWNGADPGLIGDVGRHLPGCAVLHLRTNFRSTPEICEAAGRILGREPQPAVRPPGPAPTVAECSEEDEAAVLARRVRSLRRPGAPWRHQAVLARTNAQLPPLRRALESQGIPVAARAGASPLEHPAVRDLVASWDAGASLRTAVIDARSDRHEIIGTAAAGDPATRHEIIGAAAPTARHEIISAASAGDPATRSEIDAAGAALDALLALAEDHMALNPGATVGSFTSGLRSVGRPAAAADGVELTTFHGAKGLEWPIVHIVGAEDGYVPVSHARTPEARAEERRLFHVAATRAGQELHVQWCRSRQAGDRAAERRPSPWLEAVGAAGPSEAGAEATDEAGVAEIIAETRKLLRDRPDPMRFGHRAASRRT